MKKYLSILVSLFAFAIIMTGCSSDNKEAKSISKDEKINVYTTIFPLEDFTKKIGGDHVKVTGIYPPGVDSHTYEPTTKTIINIAKADLFIYNGLELEAFAKKVADTVKNEPVLVLNASKGIEAIEEEHHHEEHADDHETEGDNHHHDVDPHVWFDPMLALKQAEAIKDELVKLKPSAKADFEKNFDALKEQFVSLDKELTDVVANAKRKEILVSHAAYGYWENHYGIKQIAIAGLSSSQEPSQKELANIVKIAQEHGIKYILFETFSTPKVADIVQKETNTTVLRLNHIATITDEDRQQGKDYFQLMQENIDLLKKAMNE
ncbi:MAG: metal ABC transporter solute-binding protein, Zn/Mn family [Bacillaceae bacterium]